jgi:hypothetical protein
VRPDTVTVRWLRSRRLTGVLSVQLVLTCVVAAWGAEVVEVPANTARGTVLVGMWVLVPFVAGSAVALALATDLADWEQAAARALWPRDLACVAALVGVAGGLFVVASWWSAASTTALAGLRNLALFTGLALVSGRLLRPALSWVLPLGLLLPMGYFGYDDTGAPHWWAVPFRLLDGATTTAALVTLAIGTCAVAWSPWTARRFRTFFVRWRVRPAVGRSRRRPAAGRVR